MHFLHTMGLIAMITVEQLYSNCIPLKDIERIIKNADKMGKPVALATKDRMAANGKDQDLIDYYAFGNAEVDVAEDFEDIKKEKVYQVLMGARVEEYQEILKGVQGAEITAWWDRAVDNHTGQCRKRSRD